MGQFMAKANPCIVTTRFFVSRQNISSTVLENVLINRKYTLGRCSNPYNGVPWAWLYTVACNHLFSGSTWLITTTATTATTTNPSSASWVFVEWNPLLTDGFPSQRINDAKKRFLINASSWWTSLYWCHNDYQNGTNFQIYAVNLTR